MIISGLRGLGSRDVDAFQRVRSEHSVPVLLLNVYTLEQDGYRALRAGATGILGRDAAADELIWAVGQVLSGKKYLAIPSKNN
jgi:DNA-binding NarL/FixJ family response regulator